MTNKQKCMPYDKATPEVLALARGLAEEAKRSRYGTAATFKAYNLIFGLNEVPSTCTSCVVSRAKAVIEWLKGYDAWAAQQVEPPTDPDVDSELGAVPLGAEETEQAAPIEQAAPTAKRVPPVTGKSRKAATPVPTENENEDLT